MMTPLRRVSPLLLLLGLAAASSPADQEAAITIALTPAGVQVTPATVTVSPGETIQWTSEIPFAVAVERNAQLFGQELPPQALRGRANAPLRAAVAENAEAGTYKYSVAVWDGENVWVVDPEIIIRRQ
jgi:plastocyanin